MLAHQRALLVFSLAAGSREMRPLPLGQRAAARPAATTAPQDSVQRQQAQQLLLPSKAASSDSRGFSRRLRIWRLLREPRIVHGTGLVFYIKWWNPGSAFTHKQSFRRIWQILCCHWMLWAQSEWKHGFLRSKTLNFWLFRCQFGRIHTVKEQAQITDKESQFSQHL